MTEPITTYVLIGHGMSEIRDAYADYPHCKIIEAQPGISFEEAVKAIKAPANVILQCHGLRGSYLNPDPSGQVLQITDLTGHFLWNEDDPISYATLYSALPRQVTYRFPKEEPDPNDSHTLPNIPPFARRSPPSPNTPSYVERFLHLPSPAAGTNMVFIGACLGGNALTDEFLKSLPAGTIAFSDISETNLAISAQSDRTARESYNTDNPIDLYIKSLDNLDPEFYRLALGVFNRENGLQDDTNPDHALPHIIGIGGNPPVRIDLNNELRTIALAGKKLDRNAWARSLQRVRDRFDNDTPCFNPNDSTQYRRSLSTLDEDRALQRHIVAIAHNLTTGHLPQGAEEKRIAYALAAAYLEESGKLGELVQHAIRPLLPHPLFAAVDPAILSEVQAMKAAVIFTPHGENEPHPPASHPKRPAPTIHPPEPATDHPGSHPKRPAPTLRR